MDEGRTTLNDLRQRCVQLAHQDGLMPRQAVEKVLADVTLDEDMLAELAYTGLRYLVNCDMSDERRYQPVDDLPATRTGTPDGVGENEGAGGQPRSGRWQHRPAFHETSARWYWLAKHYTTPDGQTRKLLEFTIEDLAHCEQWAQHGAVALQRRAGFFARARQELDRHQRAERIADLPAENLAELDGLAASALGGMA
jgi:hypothetical protein